VMPTDYDQGKIKANSRQSQTAPAIVSVGAMPAPPTAVDHLKARILAIVAAGEPRFAHCSFHHAPGVMPWWDVRQRVGGKFARRDFVAAVEALLAEGRLIEAWLRPRGRATPSHVLIRPGHS